MKPLYAVLAVVGVVGVYVVYRSYTANKTASSSAGTLAGASAGSALDSLRASAVDVGFQPEATPATKVQTAPGPSTVTGAVDSALAGSRMVAGALKAIAG